MPNTDSANKPWTGDEGDHQVTMDGKAIVGNLIMSILAKHDPEANRMTMGRTFEQALDYLSERYGASMSESTKIVDILVTVTLHSAKKSGLYKTMFSESKKENKNAKSRISH